MRERKKEIKDGRAKKKEGSFGTRKLEMITHLLNLYSTLLSLRRKKKGEVFRLLLLLLPLLLPFSPAVSLAVFLNVCHFHYAAYFAFPFVYRLVRSNLYRSLPSPYFALAEKKRDTFTRQIYLFSSVTSYRHKRVNHGTGKMGR